jgi:hypothetical protein
VLGRIDARQAAGQNRDGSAAALQGAAMCSAVDPACEAGDDGPARAGQVVTEPFRDALTVRRARSRSHDGDGLLVTRLERALDVQELRRRGDHGERCGVGRRADAAQLHAVLLEHLAFRVDIGVLPGGAELLGHRAAEERDLHQLLTRRGQDRRRRAEALEESGGQARADPGDEVQRQHVAFVGRDNHGLPLTP